MGHQGMHKNRLRRLEALQAMMFSKDELHKLDEDNSWRYTVKGLRRAARGSRRG